MRSNISIWLWLVIKKPKQTITFDQKLNMTPPTTAKTKKSFVREITIAQYIILCVRSDICTPFQSIAPVFEPTTGADYVKPRS